jgi:hypothetical protein
MYLLNLVQCGPMHTIIESRYPITFRQEDALTLGNHIRHHHSVVLIGMKRVGISNFLRFFLHHPDVCSHYIHPEGTLTHLFVYIDLNNLVERTARAFWTLTLKRIVDVIQASDTTEVIKSESQRLFTQAIQLNDTFFVLDSVQKLLRQCSEAGMYTTLFFVRFDRLQEVITAEFFANIQAVKDEALHLSFVFTSYRPLHELVPDVFTRSALSVFTQEMYLKSASTQDIEIILSTFLGRYDLQLPEWTKTELIHLSGGHVQYLHLALISIRTLGLPSSAKELFAQLSQDEELRFLSEELWSSLRTHEQEVALSVTQKKSSVELPKYLLETGMIVLEENTPHFFNPLFEEFIQKYQDNEKENQSIDKHELSRKEHTLFSLLESSLGELVEREQIIEVVWADEAELGISDWAVDRLVARLRAKLRAQHSTFKILTVITRGYKLVKE